MKRSYRRWCALILLSLLLLSACQAQPNTPALREPESIDAPISPALPEEPAQENPPEKPEEPALPEEPEEPEEPQDPLLTQAQAILDTMTDAQKIGQLFFARRPDKNASAIMEQYQLGGYLLFRRDFQDNAGEWLTEEAFLAQMEQDQTAAAIAPFFGVDEEGGTVCRASQNPNLFSKKFSSPQKLYKNGGMDAVKQDAQSKSEGLLRLGININFAPVADVSTDSGDFIYARAFGQGAEETAEYVAAVTEEMCAAGMGSVLKHFPGYGSNGDTHTDVITDSRSREQFDQSDFLPFQAGIQAGATAVLVSHNIVECMDDTLPASLSPEVHRVLREELGFEGLIFTDDLAMDAVRQYTDDGSAAVLALLAGNDMVVTSDPEGDIAAVQLALENETLSWEAVEQSCLRILRAKLALGILTPSEND